MNNLELVTASRAILPFLPGPVTGFQYQNDSYYLIINRGLHKITPDSITSLLVKSRPLLTGIQYNATLKRLFTCDSYFFCYTYDTEHFLRVGCPSQIISCAYAPTDEKIAYFDADGAVVICDVNLNSRDVLKESSWALSDPVPADINVNWGDTGTQFAGFDNTTPVDAARKAVGGECPVATPEIIWRPDGKFFLVSYKEDHKRRFKVYGVSNGVVAQNEDIPGVQNLISWRFMHNMITASCYSDNQWKLIVFEGSGNAKMVIPLELQLAVNHLKWSPEGEILAVSQEGAEESFITLFTVGNYTFEVKQQLVFRNPIRYIHWRPTRQGTQHLCVLTDGNCNHYLFRKAVFASDVYVDGASTVAVIDGHNVAFVNFESFVLPPPYRQFEFSNIVRFGYVVNRVVFNASKRAALIETSRNIFYVYSYSDRDMVLLTESVGFTLPCHETYPLNVHHLGFFEDFVMIYVNDDGWEKVIKYDLATRTVVSMANFRADLTGVRYMHTGEFMLEYVHFSNGEMYINANLYHKFEHGIRRLDKISFEGVEYLFILDNNGSLFSNGRLISANVESFVVFSQYLMYTTVDNKLVSTRLDVFSESFGTDLPPHVSFDSRALEEGGSLVVGVGCKLIAILQMPRGNVEMVSTNLLGIDSVNNLLNIGQWELGINEAKIRQLNANVLVDSDIERFIRNIDKFVATQAVGSLVDFITGLTEHNTISVMTCCNQFAHLEDTTNKIERVCSQLLEEMEKYSLGKYIDPIMVARVKVAGIQSAVNYAQQVYTKENLDVNHTVARGLMTICRYWNPEEVASACLKTYDLDFSLFAHFTYKQDPQLTAMLIDTFSDSSSEYEKRFRINNYIGDYKTATTYYAMHTVEMGPKKTETLPLEPLIDYARAHQELETVYKFLRENRVTVPKLGIELAEYLEANNRKADAAQTYVESEEFEAAFALYVNLFNWEEAVKVIHMMDMKLDEREERLKQLADHLDASGVYVGAISIYNTLYMYDRAIESCIKAHAFKEALKMAKEYAPKMIDYIKEHLYEYVASVEDLIERTTTNVPELTERVVTIWNERLHAMRNPGAAPSGDFEMPPDYAESVQSDTSAGASGTSRTSRKSRKAQRRYTDLKKGGPYEDIAIMRAIHNQITELYKMKDEVQDMMHSLDDYNDPIRAKSLETLFGNMKETFRDCIAKIWFPGLTMTPEQVNDRIIAARKNLEFLEEKYKVPPKIREVYYQ